MPVYTTVFLKIGPRVRNVEDIKKLKMKIIISKRYILLVYIV